MVESTFLYRAFTGKAFKSWEEIGHSLIGHIIVLCKQVATAAKLVPGAK
jgi:hypothetical protein